MTKTIRKKVEEKKESPEVTMESSFDALGSDETEAKKKAAAPKVEEKAEGTDTGEKVEVQIEELSRKLAALEREVKARLDTHDAAIVDVLRRVMDIIDPPALPEPPKKRIGYGIKERRAKYRTKKEGSKR